MLHVARLFLAGCLTALAGGLLAQDNLPAYSPAPMPPNRASEQQALARQYLAAPSGWASASDQSVAPSAADRYETPPVNLGVEPSPATAPPAASAELRTAFEPTAQPNRGYAPTNWPSAPAGTSNDRAESTGLGLQNVTPANRAEASEPSRLFPVPDVPAHTADIDANPDTGNSAAGYGNRAADVLPGRVVQAAHFSEASDKPAPEASAADSSHASEKDATVESETSQPPPIPLEKAREALPLTPPGAVHSEGSRPASGMPSIVTMVGGLGIVLGLFFVVAWGMRRATPGASMTLPNQVVEILGRAPLAGRHQVHLLRCGNKLLLVSVTPDATETLTEITDPFEVDRLAGLCEQARPNSSSAAFRRAFQQFAHDGKGSYAS